MSSESIFRPVCILMMGRALGFAIAFAIPVVLARLLEQSEFGTYKQLFLIFTTLYAVAQCGVAESLFYFLPAAPQWGGRYAFNAMVAAAVTGAICLALLWLCEQQIAHWFGNESLPGKLPLIGGFLQLMLMSAALEIVMTARKHHAHAAWSYALSDLLRAALLILPVVWFAELTGLLYGAIALGVVRLLVAIWYLHREFSGDVALDRNLMRAQMSYAAPFAIYVLADVVQANLHLYVVSFRFDAAAFAVYAVGCLSIPLVDFLMSSACNVMMVKLREQQLDGAKQRVLAIWADTTRKLMMVFAPVSAGLVIAASDLIVLLFTRSYEDSVSVFMIWCLLPVLAAVLTDGVLRVYAQMRFLMLLSLAKLVMVVAMIDALLSLFGLVGAALTVLLTTAATKALAITRIATIIRCDFSKLMPWRCLMKILLIAMLAMLPAQLIKSLLPADTFIRLMLTMLSYAVSYLGLIWAWGPLEIDERRVLLKWLAKRPDRMFGSAG